MELWDMDLVAGSGWMRLRSAGEAFGLIKIHLADRSTFRARRVGRR